jgi:hypothetical protein
VANRFSRALRGLSSYGMWLANSLDRPFAAVKPTLDRLAMPAVLDAVGKIGILVGVGLYLSECHDRAVERHSREWLLVATQTGKPGNGGQIEALQELLKDGVDISGIHLQNTFLYHIDLSRIGLNNIDVG